MWAAGTALGIFMGNLLPARIVSALSVALYGMFLAIIVPPAKENRVVLGCVLSAFAASAAFAPSETAVASWRTRLPRQSPATKTHRTGVSPVSGTAA